MEEILSQFTCLNKEHEQDENTRETNFIIDTETGMNIF